MSTVYSHSNTTEKRLLHCQLGLVSVEKKIDGKNITACGSIGCYFLTLADCVSTVETRPLIFTCCTGHIYVKTCMC